MKIKNIKYAAVAIFLGLGVSSCSDFLDRPVEDNYNTEIIILQMMLVFQALTIYIILHGMISSAVSSKLVKLCLVICIGDLVHT